ncbi:hypothetical protein [Xylella phage Cota]|uniref:Uncharacterized protein n=1 Tax=Xylella phage Cota TaxID=2699877 RepID=A0A6F8ZKH7_9CAUD|nr:hypothetical protein [Xylella phage Cota]
MRFADKTTISIPNHFISMLTGEIAEIIKTITQQIGGVTIESARGGYVIDDGSLCIEGISKVSWWHAPQEPALIHVCKIARALIERGEEAVLVEYQREAGTVARLLTKVDVEEQDDEC